jgi:hypothetical protein
MDWRYGLSGRAPALKVLCCPIKNNNNLHLLAHTGNNMEGKLEGEKIFSFPKERTIRLGGIWRSFFLYVSFMILLSYLLM